MKNPEGNRYRKAPPWRRRSRSRALRPRRNSAGKPDRIGACRSVDPRGRGPGPLHTPNPPCRGCRAASGPRRSPPRGYIASASPFRRSARHPARGSDRRNRLDSRGCSRRGRSKTFPRSTERERRRRPRGIARPRCKRHRGPASRKGGRFPARDHSDAPGDSWYLHHSGRREGRSGSRVRAPARRRSQRRRRRRSRRYSCRTAARANRSRSPRDMRTPRRRLHPGLGRKASPRPGRRRPRWRR